MLACLLIYVQGGKYELITRRAGHFPLKGKRRKGLNERRIYCYDPSHSSMSSFLHIKMQKGFSPKLPAAPPIVLHVPPALPPGPREVFVPLIAIQRPWPWRIQKLATAL